MTQKTLFGRLTKVDEKRRRVFGVLAEEIPDKSGEIMDYQTSKPRFQAWSKAISGATGGLSLGNVRVMHTAKVAGKLVALSFNDQTRRIEGEAEIHDDEEWKKVLAGLYSGFSMGGRYHATWRDQGDDGLTRYTAEPSEVSIVDNPCIPSATFQILKADGAVEERRLIGWSPPGDAVKARAAALAKAAGRDGAVNLYLVKAREALIAERHSALEPLIPIEPEPEPEAHMHPSYFEPDLSKIGRRNSADDQARLQAAHDALVACGALCGGHGDDGDGDDDDEDQDDDAMAGQEAPDASHDDDGDDLDDSLDDIAATSVSLKAAGAGALAKAHQKLQKQNADMGQQLRLLKARLESLEAQALPPKAAAGPFARAIDRGGPDAADLEKAMAGMSEYERGQHLLRIALSQPRPVVFGSGIVR